MWKRTRRQLEVQDLTLNLSPSLAITRRRGFEQRTGFCFDPSNMNKLTTADRGDPRARRSDDCPKSDSAWRLDNPAPLFVAPSASQDIAQCSTVVTGGGGLSTIACPRVSSPRPAQHPLFNVNFRFNYTGLDGVKGWTTMTSQVEPYSSGGDSGTITKSQVSVHAPRVTTMIFVCQRTPRKSTVFEVATSESSGRHRLKAFH